MVRGTNDNAVMVEVKLSKGSSAGRTADASDFCEGLGAVDLVAASGEKLATARGVGSGGSRSVGVLEVRGILEALRGLDNAGGRLPGEALVVFLSGDSSSSVDIVSSSCSRIEMSERSALDLSFHFPRIRLTPSPQRSSSPPTPLLVMAKKNSVG
jgi:hypothetical protein